MRVKSNRQSQRDGWLNKQLAPLNAYASQQVMLIWPTAVQNLPFHGKHFYISHSQLMLLKHCPKINMNKQVISLRLVEHSILLHQCIQLLWTRRQMLGNQRLQQYITCLHHLSTIQKLEDVLRRPSIDMDAYTTSAASCDLDLCPPEYNQDHHIKFAQVVLEIWYSQDLTLTAWCELDHWPPESNQVISMG